MMMHGKMHCLRQITMNVFKVEKGIDSVLNNLVKTFSFERDKDGAMLDRVM